MLLSPLQIFSPGLFVILAFLLFSLSAWPLSKLSKSKKYDYKEVQVLWLTPTLALLVFFLINLSSEIFFKFSFFEEGSPVRPIYITVSFILLFISFIGAIFQLKKLDFSPNHLFKILISNLLKFLGSFTIILALLPASS